MELRSRSNHLIELLKAAGAYEDGMELEEMRQVARAMEISANSADADECTDLERALVESEIDFQMLVNSTMIIEPTTASSSESIAVFNDPGCDRDCESPPSNPIQLVVRADVHHELNWSPSSAVRPPKRQCSETFLVSQPKRINLSDIIEQESHLNPEPISVNSGDSGVSCDEIGSLSSISEHSTMPSIGEMPSRLLISTSSAVVSDFSESNQSNP